MDGIFFAIATNKTIGEEELLDGGDMACSNPICVCTGWNHMNGFHDEN